MASDSTYFLRRKRKRCCSEKQMHLKVELHDFLKRIRLWDFNTLRLIMEEDDPLDMMIKELQDRGCVVTNIPPLDTSNAGQNKLVKERSLDSSGEIWQSEEQRNWSASVRKSMSSKGLYQKHSVDHPLLKAFANYLENTLENDNFRQEVENVARFLFFMDPVKVSLEFVYHSKRVQEFVDKLKESNLSQQTISNYLKSIKRFLKFHTEVTNLCVEDEDRQRDNCAFFHFLSVLQTKTSKEVGKVAKKRYDQLAERTPAECQEVLEMAKKDFLRNMEKFTGPDRKKTIKRHYQLVLYYLEAVLVLKYLQLPGVIKHMTVRQWLNRRQGQIAVTVTSTQTSTFTLSKEEERWFDMYYMHVRPLMLDQKETELQEQNNERFFISSTGKPIYKVSNDLESLHKRYKLSNITSEMARHVFKTATLNADKFKQVPYLSHESSQAEEHGCQDQDAFDMFIKSHPVTIDGSVPEKARRVSLTGIHDRYCCDRWHSEQMKLRVDRIQEHFSLRRPSEKRLSSWIQKRGWLANTPEASQVLSAWKPLPVGTATDFRVIIKMIRNQKWSGLELVENNTQNRVVLTTRAFCLGEVVCDFHGRLVSRKEGMDIYSSNKGQAGSLFFFTDPAGQDMCLDASEQHCECHPNKTVLCRSIKHSSKRPNIRPRLCSLEDKQVLLFIALRDINEGEKLKYDFGANKKAFAGEGLGLSWLC